MTKRQAKIAALGYIAALMEVSFSDAEFYYNDDYDQGLVSEKDRDKIHDAVMELRNSLIDRRMALEVK